MKEKYLEIWAILVIIEATGWLILRLNDMISDVTSIGMGITMLIVYIGIKWGMD